MKIDIAYSKEKKRLMTAIEANELWQDGELEDKHEFICPGKDCDVPITCAGMDKFKIEQKRVPHFIWSHRNIKHSEECDFEAIIYEWRQQNKSLKSNNDEKAYNEVVFEFTNINDKNTVRKVSTSQFENKNNGKGSIKNESRRLNNHSRIVKPHYSLLSSLLNLFFEAQKNNDLDNQYVMLKFAGKSYDYKLSTLFKKISNYELDSKNKIKVFYGNAYISNYDGKYYINFEDKFKNNDAKVKCTIDQKYILEVKNANAKLQAFDNQLNKKVKLFIMGIPHEVEIKGEKSKKIVYINPYKNSFDLVAVI